MQASSFLKYFLTYTRSEVRKNSGSSVTTPRSHPTTSLPIVLSLCVVLQHHVCCSTHCRCRQKLVKWLQSNPVQVLLCVVVLLDAGIVISQILFDLHSVRGKLVKLLESNYIKASRDFPPKLMDCEIRVPFLVKEFQKSLRMIALQPLNGFNVLNLIR